jgi:hypothetical protein
MLKPFTVVLAIAGAFVALGQNFTKGGESVYMPVSHLQTPPISTLADQTSMMTTESNVTGLRPEMRGQSHLPAPSPAPEPASICALAVGFAALARRRKAMIP